jgi:spermidine/putrescine transport system permease protein
VSATSATRIGWASVTPALLWTLVFFVVPFIAMGVMSLYPKGAAGMSLANYTQFFTNPSYWRALTNSLEVTLVVTLLSVLLAYPFAWILAFIVPERWQRLALMLAVLPFWTSYVVRSYSWLLVLAEKGVVNSTLVNLGLIAEPLQIANTRAATVVGFVHFFVMLLTLTIYANLKQLSPNYRKAAADLGASGIQTFIHVILPLTLPGIMVGAFLTFVLAIGDYITPQILGGNNELLMPQLIMMQIGRRGDFGSASALSLILMAVVTLAYFACARWLKLERA